MYPQQVAQDTKLGGVAGTLEGCVATQRGFGRLEKWTDDNLIKFNTGECEVLCLGRNSIMHHYMLEANQLEGSFSERS